MKFGMCFIRSEHPHRHLHLWGAVANKGRELHRRRAETMPSHVQATLRHYVLQLFLKPLWSSCGVAEGQPCLSQGTLDVLVIVFGIRTCTLDALVI